MKHTLQVSSCEARQHEATCQLDSITENWLNQIVSCHQQWDIEEKKSRMQRQMHLWTISRCFLGLIFSSSHQKSKQQGEDPWWRTSGWYSACFSWWCHCRSSDCTPHMAPMSPSSLHWVPENKEYTDGISCIKPCLSTLYLALLGSYQAHRHHQQLQDQHRQRYLHPSEKRKKEKRRQSLTKVITHPETCLR